MKNNLIEYSPTNELKKYIVSYWFFRNNTGEMISFPVVPDGCSDIIFYSYKQPLWKKKVHSSARIFLI